MFRTLLVGLFLIVFFLVSLPCYAVLFLTRRFAPKKTQEISQNIVCGALSLILKLCGADVTVTGLEQIPKNTPVLFIGNHTGYFDIVSTYPLLPAGVGFVAKQEIDRFLLLRLWMRLLHGLTFDRSDPRSGMRMILAAIDEVKNGYSMFIYPEGTRVRTGELGEFKAGSFKVATRTGCPIVPVAISGTADIFENHIPVIKPSHVFIRFGKPVLLSELTADEKKHIGPLVKERISDMLS